MVNFSVWGAELPLISRFFKSRTAAAHTEISFFEVKELHNLAYAQKAEARQALRQYRVVAARAQAMDSAYRAQLLRRAA